MPPKKTKPKSEVGLLDVSKNQNQKQNQNQQGEASTNILTSTKKVSQKKSQSQSKSKSKKRDYDENGFPIIKLVFQENLLKSLNKIYERQNHELLKIVSIEKTIPFNDLINFMDDQSSILIKEIDST
jgi:hypothetical protein